MKKFKYILEEFDAALKKYNLQNYKKLQEPLSTNIINTLLGALGVKDESIHILYGWKNGYDINNKEMLCDIFDFGTILSLESVINYRTVQKNNIFDYSFIPIVTDSSGQFLLFNNNEGANYGKIHLYSASLFHFEPVSCYDSLGLFIETTVKAYKEGAIEYDAEEDYLDVNVEQYWEIAKRINTNSDRWQR